jgi:hypothetical protein
VIRRALSVGFHLRELVSVLRVRDPEEPHATKFVMKLVCWSEHPNGALHLFAPQTITYPRVPCRIALVAA